MGSFDDYLAGFGGNPGFLNWAAFAPLSATVLSEVAADAEMLTTGRPAAFTLSEERIDQARGHIAALLGLPEGGARLDEVTLQPSTTHGLMHAFYGLRGTVLASPAEFPSVPVTLDRAARASGGGLTPRWIDHAFVTPDAVEAALDDEVTALAVSHVDFRTGYRADLAALREVLGPDRLLIVDAAQSFGVVEDDYLTADVVVGHGYKWLRAGRGTGFAWFSPRARERIEPVLSGFGGVEGGELVLDEILPPAASAQAYTVNFPDLLAVARLATALRDVRDAGVAEIEEAIAGLAEQVFEIADRHGIPVVTPREAGRRAGIVALAPEEPAVLAAALANAGIQVTTRGATIRVAVHAGTEPATLSMLDEAIASAGNETFTAG